jgi:acetoin utilization deacetylase AcuC-like enzyme
MLNRRDFVRLAACGAAGAGGLAAAGCGAPGGSSAPRVQPTGVLASEVYRGHQPGPGHPESPARVDAIARALGALPPGLASIAPRPATLADVGLCHGADYVRAVAADVASGAESLSTGDTDISRDSYRVALQAAGGVLSAVDAVVAGTLRNAFCAVRPPGHHACPARGMGFCIFNNVAIAARHAQKVHGIGRVLIVDWDVHHGNGTQEIFYEDGSVFFFSTHQWPWYPGTGRADETGRGDGLGATLNCPFAAGSGRREILGAFEERLLPAAERFRPELVLVSAGFDSRSGDPLGGFLLRDADFADLTRVVMRIADRHAQGRLVSVLEGGYNLAGLASAAAAHVEALAGSQASRVRPSAGGPPGGVPAT